MAERVPTPELDKTDSTQAEVEKKKSKKRRDSDYKKTRQRSTSKAKLFKKNEILIESYVVEHIKGSDGRVAKEKTRLFKLDDDSKMTAEDYDSREEIVRTRLCVATSDSSKVPQGSVYKTSIISVNDDSNQERVKTKSDNKWLFPFTDLEVIMKATRKCFDVIMDKKDPTQDEIEARSEFIHFWMNFEEQIRRANAFLEASGGLGTYVDGQGVTKTALEVLTTPTPPKHPEKIEEEGVKEEPKDEPPVQQADVSMDISMADVTTISKEGGPSKSCGQCASCKQEDCRECEACKDMKKYGGPGKKKMGCINKKKGCPQMLGDEGVTSDLLPVTSPALPKRRSSVRKESKLNESFQRLPSKLNESFQKSPSKLNESFGKSKKWRCRQCEGCRRKDCGLCVNCLDKTKFGGFNTKRQACEKRICEQLQKAKEFSSSESPDKQPKKKSKNEEPKAKPTAEKKQTPKPTAEKKQTPIKKSSSTGKRSTRCKECSNCKRDNCGVCVACLNMPKYGGTGTLKLACLERKCRLMTPGSTPSKAKVTEITYKVSKVNATPIKKQPSKPTPDHHKTTTSHKKAAPDHQKTTKTTTSHKKAAKPAPVKKETKTTKPPPDKKMSKIIPASFVTPIKKLKKEANQKDTTKKDTTNTETTFTSSTPLPSKGKASKPEQGQSKQGQEDRQSKASKASKAEQGRQSKGKKTTVTAKKGKTAPKPQKMKEKATKKKSKPLKLKFEIFNGFDRKHKEKDTAQKEADDEDFDWIAELVTPDDSPGEVNRTRDRTTCQLAQLEDIKSGLDKVNKSIEMMQAQQAQDEAEEEKEGVGINARFPLTGEELLQCVQTESYLELLTSIIREERPFKSPEMKRHCFMVHESAVLGRVQYHLKVGFSRLDFLDDDDGEWEEKVRAVINEKVMRPCGPPPSIARFREFSEHENWCKLNYGLMYFMHNLYQEAMIKCLQEKYNVTYEQAETELLKSRYSKKELEWVDRHGELLLQAEEKRKREEKIRRREEERLRQEEARRRYENSEDEFCVPDIDDDEPPPPLPEPGPSRKRRRQKQMASDSSSSSSAKKSKK